MRRIASASAVALALLAAPASAHPGHGPLSISVQDGYFTPGGLEISTGDTVIWSWDAGPNHSVTSDPGQKDPFDSDPGVATSAVSHPAGFTFAHTFNQTGSFRYLCRVHGFRGLIVVTDALGAPPPLDSTAPLLTKVSVTGTRLRFTLSEAATVTVDFVGARRAGGRRTIVRSLDLDGVQGANTAALRTRGLRRTTYRLAVKAIDPAGNTSRRKTVSLRLR
jgi:plastocyanin